MVEDMHSVGEDYNANSLMVCRIHSDNEHLSVYSHKPIVFDLQRFVPFRDLRDLDVSKFVDYCVG